MYMEFKQQNYKERFEMYKKRSFSELHKFITERYKHHTIEELARILAMDDYEYFPDVCSESRYEVVCDVVPYSNLKNKETYEVQYED